MKKIVSIVCLSLFVSLFVAADEIENVRDSTKIERVDSSKSSKIERDKSNRSKEKKQKNSKKQKITEEEILVDSLRSSLMSMRDSINILKQDSIKKYKSDIDSLEQKCCKLEQQLNEYKSFLFFQNSNELKKIIFSVSNRQLAYRYNKKMVAESVAHLDKRVISSLNEVCSDSSLEQLCRWAAEVKYALENYERFNADLIRVLEELKNNNMIYDNTQSGIDAYKQICRESIRNCLYKKHLASKKHVNVYYLDHILLEVEKRIEAHRDGRYCYFGDLIDKLKPENE